jgi:predicted RND superfamily exporter protein
MCLVVLLGLIVPRVTLALLWLFTGWTAALRPWWLGLLGFFLAPFTTLGYVLIHHWSGSVELTVPNLVILAIALAMDAGSWRGAHAHDRKSRKKR